MIRFRDQPDIVGQFHHRSGWKYALQCLSSLTSAEGILFDDFVDRSFGWDPVAAPHREPWAGVFHKPYGWPPWLGPQNNTNTPERLIGSSLFRESLLNLRLAIVFSRRLGDWLARKLPVPVTVASLPTEFPTRQFSAAEYIGQSSRMVIQIGYTLRNLRAIHQLPAPAGFVKARIRIRNPSADRAEQQVLRYWGGRADRPEVGEVIEFERLSDADYDELLCKSVVFLELFDSSANNTIVECIVRNSPVVVNRLPALEEYLGAGYPLFYDRFEDAPNLLDDRKVLEGHRYLQSIDKSRFAGARFREAIATSIRTVAANGG